jgi:hypothetical protein
MQVNQSTQGDGISLEISIIFVNFNTLSIKKDFISILNFYFIGLKFFLGSQPPPPPPPKKNNLIEQNPAVSI